jgi:hypothetical protein
MVKSNVRAGQVIQRFRDFLFFDLVAASVKLGDLQKQVAVYKGMKFKEIHRDDVPGE